MKFLIINGPNLNLLGRREPGIYGQENYESLCQRLRAFAAAHGSTAECFQSNHGVMGNCGGSVGVLRGVWIPDSGFNGSWDNTGTSDCF